MEVDFFFFGDVSSFRAGLTYLPGDNLLIY